MCEFALEHIADVASSPKQLQLEFRAACEEVRHPDEVPRLRGSNSIDALMDAFHDSELLRDEVLHQLARYKRLYCSIFRGFGRFRVVALLPGETLLELMKRTHDDALKWRPPGKSPAEMLALISKEKGKYCANWRENTWLTRHEDAGVTLSLRGAVGVIKGGVRRLEHLPEGQRPSIEHFTTVRNHDYQAHFIQRSKSLTNSFAVQRCTIQWDEVTMNHLAWCVIILNCTRTASVREREVLSTSKLKKDEKGMSKQGHQVGGAVITAVDEYDVPVANIDYCCSDTTGSNSSLKLPRDKGGCGGKGGAYAHLWAWFRSKGHVLFFMIWCLSHLANNEFATVMKSYGVCPMGQSRLRKKAKLGVVAPVVDRAEKFEEDDNDGRSDDDDEGDEGDSWLSNVQGLQPRGRKQADRWRIPEHLNDLVYAIQNTDGCLQFICDSEGLKRLGQPTYGVDTRWGYYVKFLMWLAPCTRRYEVIMTYLLHCWLLAEGEAGLDIPANGSDAESSEASVLIGTVLLEKIQLIKHDARRQLLVEMADPTLRIWLIFLALYGERSVLRLLNYSQNDGLGVAFKAPRIVRTRIAEFDGISSASNDPLKHEWFKPLCTFVEERSAVYLNLENVRNIVRKAARTASYYFQGEKGAESKPREQRALRWLRHPALLALGLRDEKGHAKETAQALTAMAVQGMAGICRAILPYMPDGATVDELQQAISNATDGVGVIFQPESMEVIAELATRQHEHVRLADLPSAKDLHVLLWRIGSHVMTGNFIAETVVKTLEHGLHATQRRYQAYASMLCAARHRGPVRWPMTDADYTWAAAELRKARETARATKRSLGLELMMVDLSSERIEPLDHEPQETEKTIEDMEAMEAEEATLGGINPEEKSTTMPSVKVSEIRSVLATDTVVELLWEITPKQEHKCHPALIIKVLKRTVHIRWLKNVGPIEHGVLVINEAYAAETWEIRHISDTLADVDEPPEADRPAEIAAGTRWWRRRGCGGASSSAAFTSATSASAASASGSASNAIDLQEPMLFGPARRMRGDLAYPSQDGRQWLSDVIIANAHAADERPVGDVSVLYKYPRAEVQMPMIFEQRGEQCVLHNQQACLIQQYCSGVHWHNIVLIGPERRAYYWEPNGSSMTSRHAIRVAFDAAAPAGWTPSPFSSSYRQTATHVATGLTTSVAACLHTRPSKR